MSIKVSRSGWEEIFMTDPTKLNANLSQTFIWNICCYILKKKKEKKFNCEEHVSDKIEISRMSPFALFE